MSYALNSIFYHAIEKEIKNWAQVQEVEQYHIQVSTQLKVNKKNFNWSFIPLSITFDHLSVFVINNILSDIAHA